MRDTDAQLMMEAYDDRPFLTELASLMEFDPGADSADALAGAEALPMIQHAIETKPGALKSAWPWIRAVSPIAMVASLVHKGASATADVATQAGDKIEDLENTLETIGTVLTAVPDIIITGGVVIAALMGVKFLLKYLEDKRAKEALDDRIKHANSVIDSVDKMFDPDQEVLPRSAIKV